MNLFKDPIYEVGDRVQLTNAALRTAWSGEYRALMGIPGTVVAVLTTRQADWDLLVKFDIPSIRGGEYRGDEFKVHTDFLEPAFTEEEALISIADSAARLNRS